MSTIKYPEQKTYANDFLANYFAQNSSMTPASFADFLQWMTKNGKTNIWKISESAEIDSLLLEFLNYIKEQIELGNKKQEEHAERERQAALFTEYIGKTENLIYSDSVCAISIKDNAFVIGEFKDGHFFTMCLPFIKIVSIVAYKDADETVEHVNFIHTYAGETKVSVGGIGGGVIHTNDDIVTSYEYRQLFSGIIMFYTNEFKVYSVHTERIEIVEALRAYLK